MGVAKLGEIETPEFRVVLALRLRAFGVTISANG